MTARDRFRAVVVIDTEFNGNDRGERQHVVALVAQIHVEGQPVQTVRLFEDELPRRNPLPDGPDVVYVGFVNQAEWKSFLALGWALPANCIDLFAEARCLRNLALPGWLRKKLRIRGNGLIDVARWAGVRAIEPADKESHRDLILRGGPWTAAERDRIVRYCEDDVDMTAGIWARLEPTIPPDQALFRGWFTEAIGDMEDRGLPIDLAARDRLVTNLADLRRRLILEFDHFGLCDLDSEVGSIVPERLVLLTNPHGISWPRTKTGLPEMRLKTIRRKLAHHPDLHVVVALARGLQDLRGLRDIPIGPDGRSRASLWPFSTLTGRNQPAGKEFLFALSRWTRSLIRPGPGRFVAYMDWTAQEFAIIAYLSGDSTLIRCYEMPGDPYANLGAIMGLMPQGTGKEHPLRDVIKTVVLGLFYGRGVRSIASKTRKPELFISHVVEDFWDHCHGARRWLENHVDGLYLLGRIRTRFGWTVHRHRETKSTTAMNFPVQAHGAEMMRWAACLAYENDVPFCCPVHDAFVCEGRVEDERQIVDTLTRCMTKASSIVLGGPTVRAHSVVFRYPERFADGHGWATWSWIASAIDPALAIRPARTA
jgi:hypothetical protein